MINAAPTIDIQKLTISADTSIQDIFAHFAAKPWAMLLDTCNSRKSNGRFDIMVADPVITYETRGKVTRIHYTLSDAVTQSTDDPFVLLDQGFTSFMDSVSVPDAPTDLPFLCGALGYFAYDLGRHIERLPELATTEINAPDMAVGLYSWSVIKDNISGEFYLARLPHLPAPTPEAIETLAQLKRPPTFFQLTSDWQANMSKQTYTNKINRILDYLAAGDCYQVNFAQRFNATYDGDEWQAYTSLCEANQSPFSAFIRLADSCVMSISPERFLSVNDGQVQTKPIKGTRPRAADPEQDALLQQQLQQSEKDRAENLMIVDLLRNDISKACTPGSVKVPKLFEIESYAAVHHLVSTVEGELQHDATVMDLLRGAFPGGSITGAPKVRAMEIIEELEPNRRHVYCGSIGYIGVKRDMDTSICIRTLQTYQGSIYCWAGGGIVMDSSPDSEYQESLDKVSKILPVLEKCSG